ncbi:MAG: restriction endonuclease subunit S [Prolixibacteraceae bacterium]|nr:restriction endonuclease subunit S [Prolixibacteraceae bacterium]
MNKLPKGWNYKRLDIISKVVSGYAFPSNDFSKEGVYKTIKITNVGVQKFIEIVNDDRLPLKYDDKFSSFRINTNDLVIALTRSIINDGLKVAIVPKSYDNSLLNQRVAAIKSKNNMNSFIYYFLTSSVAYNYIQEKSKSLNQPNLSINDLKAIQIPLPPLSEQTRIVSKLDALFDRIDKSIALLEENIKHTKALMASVLEEVFRDAETKWKFKKLKLITSKIGSGATPRGGHDSYKTSGISLIRSMNVHDGEFRHNGLAFIDDEQAKKLANVAIEKDDVLLNITGASVARCSIVDESILPARVNQHVSIIRPTKILNSHFLQAYLISPETKSKLLFNSSGGATREAITKSMIENLDVPVPDVKVQERIINHIQMIKEVNSKIIKEQQSKLTYLKALKSSLLDWAFKGDL